MGERWIRQAETDRTAPRLPEGSRVIVYRPLGEDLRDAAKTLKGPPRQRRRRGGGTLWTELPVKENAKRGGRQHEDTPPTRNPNLHKK